MADEPHMSQFTPAVVKPTITVAEVERLDVRVGTILSVDDVAKSAKLLKLTVDFGDHTRTILAGMKAERTDPQGVVGRQALFVVNLEPKRMAGEISQGMLFDIGFADGVSPVLAVPERAVPTASGPDELRNLPYPYRPGGTSDERTGGSGNAQEGREAADGRDL